MVIILNDHLHNNIFWEYNAAHVHVNAMQSIVPVQLHQIFSELNYSSERQHSEVVCVAAYNFSYTFFYVLQSHEVTCHV